MSGRYVVVEERPAKGYDSRSPFAKGDVLIVANTSPDCDGDVWARRETDGDEDYIRWSALSPMTAGYLDERVIRVALTVAGVTPAAVDAIIAEARRAAS